MDLIDADTLANPLNWSNVSARVYKIVLRNIKNCPKVKARPFVHAHWIPSEDNEAYNCSNCGLESDWHYARCHYCGADMEEIKEEV